jgi:hypothetical protein
MMKPYLTILLILFIAAAFLVEACGPSVEQAATMTASAWTPTPRPTATSTITPSPTPIPYDLTIKITDSAGNPIPGAGVVFPESGSGEPLTADDSGLAAWSNLPGPGGSLTVTAQGYLSGEQSLALERGPNEVVITLQRDPYGLLPSTACAAGETLLYMEDFQDEQSILKHHDDGGAPMPLAAAPGEAENIVLIHDFTSPVGDYSTYLTADEAGEFYEFGEAVWRFRFMLTEEANWGLSWNSARPTEFGGITTGQTTYTIYFNTSRHAGISRSIWNDSFQPVFDIGKPGLEDKPLTLDVNVWHYIEISTFQGRVQVWLDGENVMDVVDDMPLPPGGFSIGGGDAGIMYFDAITVCGLSAPFSSITPPVPFTP